jgi:hypothetical protein
MKNIVSLGLFLTLFLVDSFSQPSDSPNRLLTQFLGSPEYARIRGDHNTGYGEVDMVKSNIIYADDNVSKPVINVVFTSDRVVKGIIRAVPLLSHQDNVLPQNERYVMSLLDYRKYDLATKTGVIKVIDLNYDNHIPLDLSVGNSIVTNMVVTDLPESIITKYRYLLKKKDLGNPIYKNSQGRSDGRYCDLNGNGNVTWTECYTCLARSCQSNQNCSFLCGFTNVVGGYTSNGVNTCSTAMSLSCIWISIFN